MKKIIDFYMKNFKSMSVILFVIFGLLQIVDFRLVFSQFNDSSSFLYGFLMGAKGNGFSPFLLLEALAYLVVYNSDKFIVRWGRQIKENSILTLSITTITGIVWIIYFSKILINYEINFWVSMALIVIMILNILAYKLYLLLYSL